MPTVPFVKPFISLTLFNRYVDIGWRVFGYGKWMNHSLVVFHIEVGDYRLT